MSKTLSAGAVRLAGLAARLLGWRPDDFWGATPAELVTAMTSPEDPAETAFGRDDLNRMMESEHAGSG